MLFHKKKPIRPLSYDREHTEPVLRCSICTGEQTAGFRDLRTGAVQEVMLIRTEADLEEFKRTYGLTEVKNIY